MHTTRGWAAAFIIATTVVGLDQASKFLAVKHLTPAFVGARTEGGNKADAPSGLAAEIIAFYSTVEHPCRRRGGTYGRCREVKVVDGFWSWRYVENPGAAWGLFAGASESFRVPFFFLISIVAMAFILLYLHRLEANQKLVLVALSLVLGGAIGNFIDRLHLSYVIDFIDWYQGVHHWPTFNVADAAISTGVGLMLLDWVRESAATRRQAQEG